MTPQRIKIVLDKGYTSDGIDVIPNILSDITSDVRLKTSDKDACYYVSQKDEGKVITDSRNSAIVRNASELDDRVEILISNTISQASSLMAKSMLSLPYGTKSVDTSAYADDATIVLDATHLYENGAVTDGFEIIKRPGQTIVFNFEGNEVKPPCNIEVKLVNKEGQRVDVLGEVSNNKKYDSRQIQNADRSEGDVWNKIIWNFPNATKVEASNDIAGVYIVPKGDFSANKGGGWIVARGASSEDNTPSVNIQNEWIGFPGTDNPFEQKRIRKVFSGLTEEDISEHLQDYYLELLTHTNDSTATTSNNELIAKFVLSPAAESDTEAIKSGTTDEIGYQSSGTIGEDIFYEWVTPDLSLGSEHKVKEYNSYSPALIEFVGGFSGWSESAQNYVWSMRESEYDSESDFNADNSQAVFNVRSSNTSRPEYDNVTVTNYYNIVEEPHNLSLTKRVVDEEELADLDREYTFSITLTNSDKSAYGQQSVSYKIGDRTYSATTNDEGIIKINLKASETAEIVNLPYDTRYSVEEINVPSMCHVDYSSSRSGNLKRDRELIVTNTYRDDPGIPITAHKDLVGGTLINGQFNFKLVDQNGNLVKEATNDANGIISFGTFKFKHDGLVQYRMYEVADTSMTDVIFDPSEYLVNVQVEDGRAISVTFTDEDGKTSNTVPMFRNRQIVVDPDKLTARKFFVDETTGKAIRLNGGEFSFTARERTESEDPIVYTGTNDEDGMVTFVDSEENEVDLNQLTQPTEFIISEDESSYSGAVADDKVLTYDSNTYNATAKVTEKTVVTNPWSASNNGSEDITLNLTFKPKDTSGSVYYMQDQYRNGVTANKADNDTISFTIQYTRNLSTASKFSIPFDYGIGDYNNQRTKVGEVTISGVSGNWGDREHPISITSVEVDGVVLRSNTGTLKTVDLEYEAGSYPVFINRISDVPSDGIAMKIKKYDKDDLNETGAETLKGATFKVVKYTDETRREKDSSWGIEGEKTVADDPDSGTGVYDFEGIDEGFYTIIETDVPSGYIKVSDDPSFEVVNEDGSLRINFTDGEMVEFDSETNTFKIGNEPGKALPSTGGVGTTMLYIVGALLIIGSGALLLMRRKRRAN